MVTFVLSPEHCLPRGRGRGVSQQVAETVREPRAGHRLAPNWFYPSNFRAAKWNLCNQAALSRRQARGFGIIIFVYVFRCGQVVFPLNSEAVSGAFTFV